MRFAACICLVFLSLKSLGAGVRNGCDRSCRHQQGLDQVQQLIMDHAKNGMQDADCPSSGIETHILSQQIEGGIMSAEGMIRQMQQVLRRESVPVQQDRSKCGVCSQNNIVSPVTVSRPKVPTYDVSCENRPTETLRGDFSNENEAADFVKGALQGQGSDGERLYAACPDPCSFNVYNGQTSLSSGKIRLNLVVQCGMPKGGIFSKYVFNGALVHEWTCTHESLH